jgi:hypothetical protein
MNKYTKDFFENSFPGYTPTYTFEQNKENFWFTKDIPFLELDINLKTNDSYELIKSIDHEFHAVAPEVNQLLVQQKRKRDWFFKNHSYNKTEYVVLGYQEPDGNMIKGPDSVPMTLEHVADNHPDTFISLQTQLNDSGFKLERLWISKLNIGGYMQPHRDLKLDNYPTLAYLWIPLHDPTPTMKVWPHGLIDHKIGSVYLLNHQNFVHSVMNSQPHNRYVALSKFDYTKVPKHLWQQITSSLKNQWYSN